MRASNRSRNSRRYEPNLSKSGMPARRKSSHCLKAAAKAVKEKLTKWWTEKKPFTSKDGWEFAFTYKIGLLCRDRIPDMQ